MTSPQQLAPADDLYLAAHDGIGGRLLLSPEVLGVGLGAALLGELMFWQRVVLGGDGLRVIDDRPTGDPATTQVLKRLAATTGPQAPDRWIAHLSSGPAVALIEQRLTLNGVLRRETKRRLLSVESSLVFSDPRSPGQPAGRIRTHLSYNRTLDTADLMLAGLILATGLDTFVLDTVNPRDRARLSDQFRRNLPQPLHQLVSYAGAVGVS
ncbi:GPP34 family phosphoprotein [Actinoplanes sp. NBC_00393]|uniref:GOLPH3/VPS74 family protein n=1 Tax=Actinoplanes sp. NBC_00393 TaxID=2975953 RepID=UPI002E1A2F91